jgi:hypothetical protein
VLQSVRQVGVDAGEHISARQGRLIQRGLIDLDCSDALAKGGQVR